MSKGISKVFSFFCLIALLFMPTMAQQASMDDYCIVPHFISTPAPPLVLFVLGRDHKLYYEAYNDASDLNDDGILDTTYDHSIDYYGYFDPYKCYEYSSSGQAKFVPVSNSSTKFCSTGKWSGNILNWLTMSRIDVLRKVLYGGKRVTDSASETVLERAFIPQDAHSWGKEFTGRLCYDGTKYTKMCAIQSDCGSLGSCVDKSQELIGMPAPPGECLAEETTSYSPDKILVVKYAHSSSLSDSYQCGTNYANLLASYEPGRYLSHFYINDMDSDEIDPNQDNIQSYSNFFATADFRTSVTGTWQFAIDGNEGVHLEIQSEPGTPGTIVASYYGCHSLCNYQTHSGNITLSGGHWYRLIVRHTEKTGKDGFKVWYKKPGETSWKVFGTNSTDIEIRAPYVPSTNSCALMAQSFIQTGTPASGAITTGPITRHLFCNLSKGDGPSYPPLLRMLQNKTERIWQWASKERPVCDNSLGTPTEYEVRVSVCMQSGSVSLEQNCKYYPSSGGIYKPIGLLQKYGEGDGSKVCSKTMAKACNTDSDCEPSTEGLCVERSGMYYGLISGTYEKNLSGGVLRKNIWTILDETNAQTGIFQTSESTQGNIILTLDKIKIAGFRYSDYSYQASTGGTCGWITTAPLSEGQCKDWGNPIGEMMYEGLRYFAGKGTPTSSFTYGGGSTTDASLGLSKKDWGIPRGSNTYQTFEIFPACSKPFLVVLSDVNVSYDSNSLPGSYFNSFTGDLPNLNVSQLANEIGQTEGINGNSYFIGMSGSSYDFICSSKTISNLGETRGICPEEPTKQGSFYSASISWYGKTLFSTNTGKPNVTTFSVALASQVADLRIKVGDNYVSLVPVGKSVSGCLQTYNACAQKCTLTNHPTYGIRITNCVSGSYCPSNQIVDYYVETITYDSEKNVTYAKFNVNFEDVEQGADHDMDAIVNYEICTGDYCDPSISSNEVKVKLSSNYAAGCIDQVLGFVISGTTQDGLYLPVKDKDIGSADSDTPAVVANLPLTWEKVFTVSENPAGFLKDPLWYAAKWGGFEDINGNNRPDLQKEWDRFNNNTGEASSDGIPDTYFKVVNPLKLEQQMERVFSEILRRTVSGTAASVLSSSEGSGANLFQAVFYPKRAFGDTEIDWTGELQNLWYYVDPFLQASTIRDDFSNGTPDKMLKLTEDYVLSFYFDPLDNKTKVKRYMDTDGDGDPDTYMGSSDIDDIINLWKAGTKLHERDLNTDPRTIYTTLTGNSLIDFSTSNASLLSPYLDVGTTTQAQDIIRYVHGFDIPGLRNRTVTIGTTTGTWKLGDIVSATPKVQSGTRLNTYHLNPPQGYKDTTYYDFIRSTDYITRGMVYVGSNDGMLHAFKLGTLDVTVSNAKAQLCTDSNEDGQCSSTETGGSELGKEEWAFIPKNALPYLKYLADPDYCHLYYVDMPAYLFDASIANPADCTATNYWECEKKTTFLSSNLLDYSNTSWRTILIAGMGLGGACRQHNATCSDCVKTPVQDPSDSTKSLGYSSYFALDVTRPYSPTLLWEFGGPELGYSLSGPAVLRIGEQDKNGRWFVVFASGPTGPINTTTHEFLGRSDQNLRLFVLDLKTGELLRTIDTGIQYAFGSSLYNTPVDVDRGNQFSPGHYKDDALYIGYTKKCTSTRATSSSKEACTAGTWSDGGVLRLFTKESIDPADWVVSKVIEEIGPVTAAVTRLQDRKAKQLWIYFATGRYFNKSDDLTNQRSLYGIKEPAYTTNNTLDYTTTFSVLSRADLDDQTTSPSSIIEEGKKGWYINLDAATTASGSERLFTDPLATPGGVVYFTTFAPNSDVCSFGGNTYLWAVNYRSGAAASSTQLRGKALLQVSTGAIEEIDLPGGITQKESRRTSAMLGVPPKAQGLAIVVPPSAVEKLMHLKRR